MEKRNLFQSLFFSAAGLRKYYRLSLFPLLVPSVFLSGCAGMLGDGVNPLSSVAAEVAFEQHEIVTGRAKHQTVLTGFLFGGNFAEIVVVGIDGNDNRSLRIYAFDNNTWRLRLDTPLRREVLCVDVANINGRDRLITYERGRLNWFDPESETEHTLVRVPSMTPPPSRGVPHVDITHDVNGDARDDLVVPDTDGFWVFIQTTSGAFADPVKLGATTQRDTLYDVKAYRYNPWEQSRIHEIDYNRDGRNDLVFWNGDHFAVHHQDKHGLFDPVPTTFTTDVAFDADDLTSLAAPYGIRRRRRDYQPTGNLTGRVLHTLTDMNGDGVADLGVFSLKGGSLWHMHATYEVYFGTPTPNGDTAFAPNADTALDLNGIPYLMEQHDFGHGGKSVMVFAAVIKPSVFRVARMLVRGVLTGAVSLDIEFYRMAGGSYPDAPNAVRKVKLYPGDKTGERSVLSSVLIGDVNGDKRADLLVQHAPKILHVFRGVPGPDVFAKKPQKIAVATPFDERHIWLADLNTDAKQDVLVYHPSTIEPHRVTLLIAR